MPVYPSSVALEMKLDGSNWTDVSSDTVGDITGAYGIRGHGPKDRVAGTGTMEFELNNSASNSGGLLGYYSPNHANARSGFDIGLPVRLKVSYDGLSIYKFYGMIPPDGIEVMPGQYKERRTRVRVEDWFGIAAKHELDLPELQTDYAIEDVWQDILANMDITPQSTTYGSGQDTFPTAFDTSRKKTKALSEGSKVTRSEYGYAFRKGNITDGDELVIQGRYTRNDTTSATSIPVGTDSAGKLLLESGDALLLESGDYLLLDETQSASFAGTMRDMQPARGKHQSNKVKVTVYPREVDSSNVVLYKAQNTPEISAGDTITLRGSYRDPDGRATRVAGQDMVTPVATTDYQFNAQSDGGGTDLTSDLSVTADYGASEVEYTLENTGTQTGFVTKLEARGKGVYLYEPVDRISEDATSIGNIGSRITRFNMLYQDDIGFGKSLADVILERQKDPETTVERIDFRANRDSKHMMAFMRLEPGDRITASETVTNISGDWFINGMEFKIQPGKIIDFTVYPIVATDNVYWVLGTSPLGEETILAW